MENRDLLDGSAEAHLLPVFQILLFCVLFVFAKTEVFDFLEHIRGAKTAADARAIAAVHTIPKHPDSHPLCPRIDCTKAVEQLQWRPHYTPEETLADQCASLKEAGMW